MAEPTSRTCTCRRWVSGGPVEDHAVRGGRVETTQIAPTILKILGFDPSALKAVRMEHTATPPLSEGDAAPSE